MEPRARSVKDCPIGVTFSAYHIDKDNGLAGGKGNHRELAYPHDLPCSNDLPHHQLH